MSEQKRYLALESLLIVVSILIAFAIDAWWEDRRDRMEEVRILESLREECLAVSRSIPWYVERHRRTAEYSRQLTREMREVGHGGTVSMSALTAGWLLEHNSTDPQRGALDAMLLSGELRYISNPAIRERLARWPQRIDDATENEVLLRNTWGPRLADAMFERADVSALGELEAACWDNEPAPGCHDRQVTLPYSTEIMGYLQPVGGFSAEAATELEILADEAMRIVELINAELDAG